MIKQVMTTIDTTDAVKLGTWWAECLGGEVANKLEGRFALVMTPAGQRIGFQQVTDPTPGKNRIHFDLSVDADDDRDAIMAGWIAAGATHLGHREGPMRGWDTFADPEGNQFCLGDQ